jgi:hypothetical protein
MIQQFEYSGGSAGKAAALDHVTHAQEVDIYLQDDRSSSSNSSSL